MSDLHRPAARASARCHHGELLQGVFLDDRGRARSALVTLPVPHRRVHAEFRLERGGGFTVNPADRTKALRAARMTVAIHAGESALVGGRLRIESDVPIGIGMGSSTSDVVAAIRAVSACLGLRLPAKRIGELAVLAEGACDPVMFDQRPRLFAQREAETLEELAAALPPLAVLGCVTGSGAPVDTLALGSGPLPADVDEFERLRAELRVALAESDVERLGRVCTASARHNQRILPKPELPALERIARRSGAAGVQIAHSGNVAGLVFADTGGDTDARIRRATRLLHDEGIPVTGTFRPTRHVGASSTVLDPCTQAVPGRDPLPAGDRSRSV
ncbi:hypothetical protein [Prauserella rugosa]|uniref:Threonine kinase n=1 Tax=Prauserella rugosa TaxID=43354 RepID=A0A660CID9_9PSEU|nr:hypothetical protein [Prauserella rugosa]TWH20831.1 threonine kinase [Prauserella rugosa]